MSHLVCNLPITLNDQENNVIIQCLIPVFKCLNCHILRSNDTSIQEDLHSGIVCSVQLFMGELSLIDVSDELG